jgi:2,3,4,5-tetrahydropyridine-2-carboxylate N-succinyltransferase
MTLRRDRREIMTDAELLERVDALYAAGQEMDREEGREVFDALLEGLESGRLRAAERTEEGWRANASVKRGILLGFRLGQIVEMGGHDLQFSDKDTYPAQTLPVLERNIRVVPGGNSVRRGAYIGERVTMMPPAFVNVGAWVGEGTMVDSHALVGSCAQIGARVHLSASAQIGGVLEPVGQSPVIVEDDALVGGNTGLYEGVQVGARAVIGAGVVLTASTPVYDLVRERELRATADSPLIIPPGAVVVPGARPARGGWAAERGLMLAAALIVKYRDEKTDARAALEEALR